MPFSLLSAGVKTSRGQEEEETRSRCIVWEMRLDLMHSPGSSNQAISPSRELVLLLSKTFFSVVVTVFVVVDFMTGKFGLSETLFS